MSGLARRQLTLDNTVAAELAGSEDAVLRELRGHLDCDFHLRGNSLSRWKYRQVDCFIAASEAIRQMLIGDGVPANRTVTVHEGIDAEHAIAAPA